MGPVGYVIQSVGYVINHKLFSIFCLFKTKNNSLIINKYIPKLLNSCQVITIMYSTLKHDALPTAVCLWELNKTYSLIKENHKHLDKTLKKNFYHERKTIWKEVS